MSLVIFERGPASRDRAHALPRARLRSVRPGAKLSHVTSRRPLSARPAPIMTTTMPTMSAASQGLSGIANTSSRTAACPRCWNLSQNYMRLPDGIGPVRSQHLRLCSRQMRMQV